MAKQTEQPPVQHIGDVNDRLREIDGGLMIANDHLESIADSLKSIRDALRDLANALAK